MLKRRVIITQSPDTDTVVRRRLIEEEMERRLEKHLQLHWCRKCMDWHKAYEHNDSNRRKAFQTRAQALRKLRNFENDARKTNGR